jgi:type IV secretory pathway VirB4 component
MRRHICIFGTTDSGKTTCAGIICTSLASHGVSTVVPDRTGEYVEILSNLEPIVLTPSENLTVPPFKFKNDEHLSLQIEDWLSLLDHFFFFYLVSYSSTVSPLQARILRSLLSEYYHGTKETLTISRLIAKLDDYERKVEHLGGWAESVEATVSRVHPLTVDLVGRTFNVSFEQSDATPLFQGKLTIVDLSKLPDDRAKNLLSQMITKKVYESIRRRGKTDDLRRVFLIDEAQHLAPNDEEYIRIPDVCAMELRKYGFSLITCTPKPSLFSSNVIALISFMLNNRQEIKIVSGFLGGEWEGGSYPPLRFLPVGHAVLQLDHPAPKDPVIVRTRQFHSEES